MPVVQKQDFYHVSLKLLLKNNEGHVLILKARSEGSMEGFYDVPGGRIDTDEFTAPFEMILRREVKEEIGDVEVSINLNPVAVSRGMIGSSVHHEGEEIHILYIFFEADYHGGDIVISDELTDHKWVDLGRIDPKDYFNGGILEGIQTYLEIN